MKRVNKIAARNLYNAGKPLTIAPCKMRPEHFGVHISAACGRTFESLVNEFEYYNCSYPTGDYAAYYIEEE